MYPIHSLFTRSSIEPPVLPFALFFSYVNAFNQILKKEVHAKQIPSSSLFKKSLNLLSAIQTSVKSFFKKKPRFPFPPIAPRRVLHVEKLPDPPFYTYAPPRYFWYPGSQSEKEEYCSPSNLLREIQEEPEMEENAAPIIAFARLALPHTGILKQDNRGFVYVDVSDEYFESLLSLLPEGAERPPYYSYDGPKGAHFGVMLSSEYRSRKGFGKLKGLGEKISFTPKGFYSVKPESWPEMEKVWYMAVSSLDAENFRQRYLLPSKIYSHDFLIVIGVKKKVESDDEVSKPLFRINVSCYAA